MSYGQFFGMAHKPETPKVGVGVVIQNADKEILLILRKGSHGAGLWSLPGGHMECGEGFYDTCKREVFEEVGIVINAVKPIGFTNDIFEEEGLHYVTLFFEADVICPNHAPAILEPDKTEKIEWFSKDKIRHTENLFPPLRQVFQIRQTK